MVLSYFSSKTTKDKDFFELKHSLDLTQKNKKKLLEISLKIESGESHTLLSYFSSQPLMIKMFLN